MKTTINRIFAQTAFGLAIGFSGTASIAQNSTQDKDGTPSMDWSRITFAKSVKAAAPSTVTVVCLSPFQGEDLETWNQLTEEHHRILGNAHSAISLDGTWYSPVSHGSGFVIDKEGHIVTNNHVVESDEEVHYAVSVGTDESWHKATLIGRDPSTDIAVLRLDAIRPEPIAWGDSEALEQGDLVLAIGTPRGLHLRQTVTLGVVSATGRAIDDLRYEDYIQTDASINGGNSGGPLINLKGEVIGVNQSILLGMITTGDGSAARMGDGSPLRSDGNIGLGLAVPSNLARSVARELIDHGRVRRGFLGVKLGDAATDSSQFGASVRVTDVLPGTPAEQAGMKAGDLLISLDGKAVDSVRTFHLAVSMKAPSTKARISLIRNRKPVEVEATLADLAETRYAAIGFDPTSHEPVNLDGIEIQSVSNGYDEALVVARVRTGSQAEKAGLTAPSMLAAVAGVPVTTFEEFSAVAATSVQDGHLLLSVRPLSRKGLGETAHISLPVQKPSEDR